MNSVRRLLRELRNPLELVVSRRLLVTTLTAVFAAAGHSQTRPATREITGTVTDGVFRPIPHSVVQVVGTSIFGIADHKGRYRLCNLPTPTVALRAVYIGYAPQRKDSVELREPVTIVDFRLAISPQAFQDTVSISNGSVATSSDRRSSHQPDSVEVFAKGASQTCHHP